MTLLLPKINEATIPTQTEFECLNGYTIDLKSGIWYVPKDGGEIQKVKWDHFQITAIFCHPTRPELDKYWFELNRKKYNKTFYLFKEMIKEIATYCDVKTSHDLGAIVRQYIAQAQIPTIDTSSLIGFTETGWQLPNKFAFTDETGEMYNFVSEIKKALEHKYDDPVLADRIPGLLKQIHAKISIQFKDLILLWGLFSPFASVYQQFTSLMPFLGLVSDLSGIGKSETLDNILGKKIWGYNPTVMHDRSTTSLSYISMLHAGLTFYRFHDEMDKCPPEILRYLKSLMTVTKQRRTRMGTGEGGQKTSSDLTMSAPFCFAANTFPDEFGNDEAFRARGIILYITKKDANFKVLYDELATILNTIGNGEIGAYIYQQTKDWTAAQIKELITTAKKDPNLPEDSREYQVYLYFKVAQLFCAKVLGLELSLDGLLDQIHHTVKWVNNDIIEAVECQLQAGRDHENINNGTRIPPWVTVLPQFKKLKNTKGLLYGTQCLRDLNKRLAINLSLEKLKRILEMAGYDFSLQSQLVMYQNGGYLRGLFFI